MSASASERGVSAARWRESRWGALGELALVLALVAGDFYGLVPVTSTPFLLGLGWISLRLRGLGWRDVGFAGLGQGTRGAWLVSLVVASALFGWGHGGQGLTGMLQEGFAGCLLGLLYLWSGRNLTVPIVAHGVANTVAFILIFFDRYPGV